LYMESSKLKTEFRIFAKMANLECFGWITLSRPRHVARSSP